jgi:AraC-like DNA-binding protein
MTLSVCEEICAPKGSYPMDRDPLPSPAASDYREFLPAPELREHFLCLWSQSVNSQPCRHLVLPDACIDIVLIDDAPPVVVGPWTKPFIAHLAAGSLVVGARFHPGSAGRLLGLPVSDLLDLSVPLADVWNKNVVALFSSVGELPDIRARRAALESAILRRLSSSREPDRTVIAAIRAFAHQPEARIEPVSRFFGISSRQLQRRFRAAVGYGPKLFQSVLRFQRLLHIAGAANSSGTLVQSSVEAGYADQPHMTREVRRFADTSPSSLLGSARSTLQMSDFFKTHVRGSA